MKTILKILIGIITLTIIASFVFGDLLPSIGINDRNKTLSQNVTDKILAYHDIDEININSTNKGCDGTTCLIIVNQKGLFNHKLIHLKDTGQTQQELKDEVDIVLKQELENRAIVVEERNATKTIVDITGATKFNVEIK